MPHYNRIYKATINKTLGGEFKNLNSINSAICNLFPWSITKVYLILFWTEIRENFDDVVYFNF